MLRAILSRGWYPALITAIAVLSLLYYDDIPHIVTIVVPVLIVILCIGLVVAIINARKSELERQSMRLSQLASYFHRRFLGNSSLSIFAVIDTLYSLEKPEVWDWARACDMSQRIFDSWSDNFIARVETDLRNRRYAVFLQTHLNELWAMNNHYYEFIEQFCEIADKFQVSQDTLAQYNRFVTEYNAFVENFRETITELKTIARTQIEAPSVKPAPELTARK
jgi:hypothetical protein